MNNDITLSFDKADFTLPAEEHEITVKDNKNNVLCSLNINKSDAVMMSKAKELHGMVRLLLSYIENRDVAGEGVEEFLVSEANRLLMEAM